MDNAIDNLLQQPGIWRAGAPTQSSVAERIATGYDALDQALPGGGWPAGALTEILHERSGIGELRLLVPALARLSHQGKWIALIAPPHIPYAPALAGCGINLSHLLLVHPRQPGDALWAVEQAMRAGTCGAVLAWPSRMDDRSLRRLQLAAEAGGTLGVLFRAAGDADTASPAALRIRLTQEADNAVVDLIKCRGGSRRQRIPVELTATGQPAVPSSTPRPTPTPIRTDHPPRPAQPARPQRLPRNRATAPSTSAAMRRNAGSRQGQQLDLPLTPPRPPRPQARLVTEHAGAASVPLRSGPLSRLWGKLRD